MFFKPIHLFPSSLSQSGPSRYHLFPKPPHDLLPGIPSSTLAPAPPEEVYSSYWARVILQKCRSDCVALLRKTLCWLCGAFGLQPVHTTLDTAPQGKPLVFTHYPGPGLLRFSLWFCFIPPASAASCLGYLYVHAFPFPGRLFPSPLCLLFIP